MQTLTPKQKLFARCVGSGMTLADSYRKAYSAKHMKSASIRVEASRLMSNPDITLLSESIQGQNERAVVAASLSDRERVLTKLRDILDATEGGPAVTAQLRAAELLGKSVGLFKDVQVQEAPRSADEVRAELEEKLAVLLDQPGFKFH